MITNELLKEAKKYKVPLTTLLSISICDNERISLKKLVEEIKEFLEEYKLEDAYLEVDVDGHDYYFQGFHFVSDKVLKTEEQLKRDIERAKVAKLKEEEKQKKIEEKEIETLKALQKKYSKKLEVEDMSQRNARN